MKIVAISLAALAFAGASAQASVQPPVAGATRSNVKAGPAGLYGRDHCSPYDEKMEPAFESEVGYYCRSKKPASVTCRVAGWVELDEGENGRVLRPVLGQCDPPGGWAGSAPVDPGPQAP